MGAWASSGRGRGVDVCHLSAPCEPQKATVRLCVGGRDASPGLWTFSTPESTAARICFTELFFFFPQQKGNRCAVMSTVDYSCNIARKYAPPQPGRTER